ILYGLNWAKKAIAKRKQVIIVEGYTDVMAMHIAGFYNTVGTCGTAFQNSHAKLLRRIMGDWGTGIGQNFSGAATGEVIFIFDGDAAGQAAAQKSFKEDQSFASETLVAIVPDNLDPCDLRIKGGDAAISDLVDSAIPLFEYIIKTQIKQVNLERVEGRIQGLRLSAPILASIKDSALKIQYTHLAAGWLRLDYTTVLDAVKEAFKTIQAQKFNGDFENQGIGNLQATKKQKELSMDDAVLSSILQYPKYVPEAYFKKLDSSFFRQPYSKAIYNLILESGGLEKAKEMGSKEFSQLVFQNADDSLKGPISIFINAPLALDSKTRTDLYVQEIFKTLILKKLNFFISEYQKKVKSLGKGEEKEKDDLVKKILRMEKIKSNIKK
ncbi:MAG: toprim domain-containing protein, partial [Bifidobacteriaceae bacterium]|nr:toprim domain-containing protein [Bifidobacteriaceae bacterium]